MGYELSRRVEHGVRDVMYLQVARLMLSTANGLNADSVYMHQA